jgi:hypothetical protein
MHKRGKIVVLHFACQMPLAGIAWQALHYLVALEKLGYEAWYVEDNGANPYDPQRETVAIDPADNVANLRAALTAHGFGERWAYWHAATDRYYGLARERARELFGDAAAIVNLCGATRLRDEHLVCPVRIFVDTDPGYHQIKYFAGDPAVREYLGAHTHFFTYGVNIGDESCPLPLSGIAWRPTRPPVDLDLWPAAAGEPECFTTIASWDNSGKDIDFAGSTYLWSKHTNFLKYLDLPRHTPGTCFRMAMLPPDPAITREITAQGWRLVDPRPVSATLAAYQAFINGSRGEFTVAKDIYVRPHTGWFSDRSVCYLAAGRPVVTMRTGAGGFDRPGRGLFDYASHDEAVAAIDAIAGDYAAHSRAAREIAGDHFAGERVVGSMITAAGL